VLYMAYNLISLESHLTCKTTHYQQPLRDLLLGSTPGFLGRGIVNQSSL
jgi:hypothetical protein